MQEDARKIELDLETNIDIGSIDGRCFKLANEHSCLAMGK